MYEKLFILLETKSFSELNNEEKEFVLQNITEQEYNEQRDILSISSEIIDEDLANITVDTNMYNNLAEVNKTNSNSFLEYKVSLIKVAAVFLVAFISYHLIMAHIYKVEEQKPVIVDNTDTIYKVEKIYNTDTVYLTEYKTKFIKKDCDKKSPKITQSTLESNISKEKFDYYKQKMTYDLANNKARRKGKNLSSQKNIFKDTLQRIEDNVYVGIE